MLAFAAFADAPVDVAVIEVGMGGEWDSTNVADGQVAVFTPIALDHTARLGDTLAEIAATKSGIIKPARPSVIGHPGPEAADRVASAPPHTTSATLAIGGESTSRWSRAGRRRWTADHGAGPAGTYSDALPAALRRSPGPERGARDRRRGVVPCGARQAVRR